MIYLLFALNFLLMIGVPIVLGMWLARRFGLSWRLFGIGAATFVGSQILHIPFNALVLQQLGWISMDTSTTRSLIVLALFLGLSAGVFEEGARYLAFRFWAKDARSWRTGLMVGTGHGGIEAILVGALGAVNVVVLGLMQNGWLLDSIPAEQLPLLDEQITAVFSTPLPMIMLGALERIFAICAHLAMSLLVMQVFVCGQKRWLLYSILWHTALNFTAVYAVTTWGAVATEGLIGIFALLSVGIIFWLRAPEPVPPEPEPLPEMKPLEPVPLSQSVEKLDESKYS